MTRLGRAGNAKHPRAESFENSEVDESIHLIARVAELAKLEAMDEAELRLGEQTEVFVSLHPAMRSGRCDSDCSIGAAHWARSPHARLPVLGADRHQESVPAADRHHGRDG
jgi:hypothetical protein